MLCPNCHAYVAPEDAVCPICGTSVLPAEGQEVGIQAFRQGRKQTPPPAPAPADLSASRPGRTAAVSAARRRPVGSAPAASRVSHTVCSAAIIRRASAGTRIQAA